MISYKFDIPFVSLGALYNFVDARIPISPSTIPMPIPGFYYTDHMTFIERVVNTLVLSVFSFYDPFLEGNLAEM